jgi:hypothetical protein
MRHSGRLQQQRPRFIPTGHQHRARAWQVCLKSQDASKRSRAVVVADDRWLGDELQRDVTNGVFSPGSAACRSSCRPGIACDSCGSCGTVVRGPPPPAGSVPATPAAPAGPWSVGSPPVAPAPATPAGPWSARPPIAAPAFPCAVAPARTPALLGSLAGDCLLPHAATSRATTAHRFMVGPQNVLSAQWRRRSVTRILCRWQADSHRVYTRPR